MSKIFPRGWQTYEPDHMLCGNAARRYVECPARSQSTRVDSRRQCSWLISHGPHQVPRRIETKLDAFAVPSTPRGRLRKISAAFLSLGLSLHFISPNAPSTSALHIRHPARLRASTALFVRFEGSSFNQSLILGQALHTHHASHLTLEAGKS